ncbi:trigger factor [Eisenibacter elegans]|uniref:trigger factor n=1 Tax=Eisenibacter elegans TaxID=997 RepID=UPI00041E0966|nr:trigger factor [Eisenibacter elegans]
MDITLEKNSNTTGLIKVTINERDYQPGVEKKLKEYSKRAQIKGFRPGKVPVGLMRKMYGIDALVEEVNQLVGKGIDEYLEAQQIRPIFTPELATEEDVDWQNQKAFEFTFKLGFTGDFTYDLNSLKLKLYDISPLDKTIDETIEQLQQQFGETTEPETAEATDAVMGELYSITAHEAEFAAYVAKEAENGNTIDETEKEDFQPSVSVFLRLPLDKMTDAGKALFVGINNSAVVTIEDLDTLFGSREELAKYCLRDAAKLEELYENGPFKFATTRIHRHTPAPLGLELYSKVFSQEENPIETEEAFRAKIMETIRANYASTADRKLVADFREALLNSVNIDFPEEYVKEYMQERMAAEEYTKFIEEDGLQQYSRMIRWDRITEKLQKEHEAEVAPDAVMKRAVEEIQQQFGINDLSVLGEYATQFLQNYLTRDNNANYQRLFNDELTVAIVNKLKPSLQLETVALTIDEFEELLKTENEQAKTTQA